MNFMTSTYKVYLVCDEIKEDKKGRAYCRHGGERKCLHDFGGEPAGKKPTGIHKYIWEDNTNMDDQETGWDGADWSHLTPGRGQGTGARKHGNKFLDFVKYGGLLYWLWNY